jgi:CheY-like chemotaxis protein
VLAFTGRASAHDKRAALAAGFQLYLSKPIDIDRLRDSVAQLVVLIGSTER